MKRMMICLTIALLLITMGLCLGNKGTYRIHTGMRGGWYVEDCDPPYDFKPAEAVDRFSPRNPWDSESYSTPMPWYKLYLRDEACWISWNRDGTKPTGDYYPPGKTMWVYSPSFKMYNHISRATIWIAVDDYVDMVLLRNLNSGSYIDLGITVSGRDRLKRFDVTDHFRSCSAGNTNPPYQLEFFIRDVMAANIGLIAYMSYDCDEGELTEPTEYSYNISDDISMTRDRYISMPFYAIETSPGVDPTLRDLFGAPNPFFENFYVYNNATGEVDQPLDIDAPLRGQIGDSVRTYPIKLSVRNPVASLVREFEGWPVLEQRYLDINNNNILWFGSVTNPRDIPFSGSSPDDYPDYKILGTRTWEYWGPDGGTADNPRFPTNSIYTGYAYKTVPTTGAGTLPYSLDIDAKCEFRGVLCDDKYAEPKRFDHSRSEFDHLYEEYAGRGFDVMDTNTLNEYYEELRRIELLPGLPLEDFEALTGKVRLSNNRLPEISSINVSPNPFNSSVAIDIHIPNDSEIELNIFNISGQLVRELYSGAVRQGTHQFVWDGRDGIGLIAPSGLYYCKSSVSGASSVSKIVLVK
jgi:hypothetical protein